LRQVGTTHVAQKQGVAAKQGGGFSYRIEQQKATALQGMPGGGVLKLKLHFSKMKGLLVFRNKRIKAWICRWSIHDRGTRFPVKLQMPTHKISVKMCLEDVLRPNSILF
jgi:hypothetical protein